MTPMRKTTLRISTLLRNAAAAVAVAGTIFFAGASASADDASALALVQAEQAKIEGLLRSNAGPDDTNKVIDSFVNWDLFAQRSLGQPCPPAVPQCTNQWAKLTPDQQKEMTGLLRQVLEKSYRKTISKTLDYNSAYKPVSPSPLGDSRIRSLAKSKLNPRDPEIQVDYLINGDKCVDMVTEGASVTKNYYDALNKKITNEGYPAAVAMLNKKINAKP
jgi:phospholipid transport system substrate-binding protein